MLVLKVLKTPRYHSSLRMLLITCGKRPLVDVKRNTPAISWPREIVKPTDPRLTCQTLIYVLNGSSAFGQERLFFLAKELSAYPIGAPNKQKRRQTNSCNGTRCCNCPSECGFNQSSKAN